MDLKNKVAVVTGGSEGLGFSIAKRLIEKNVKVIIIGRNIVKLEKAVKELGENAKYSIADVSKYKEISKVANEIDNIDILINNAGIWLEGNIESNSEQLISDCIDTNLKGVIYSTKVFLPKLQKDSETNVINISSTSGLRGRENQSVYVASKFGVTGFTESLKEDLKNTNIKVMGFYPGGMKTSLFSKSGNQKDNSDWMDTDKVAEVIIFMLEKDITMVMDHVVLDKRGTKIQH